jgi:putative phosphoribosyl transferase
MVLSVAFKDRFDAGRKLAKRLAAYADDPDVIVLALPRGGVPVGYEVARTLHVAFDVYLVRKLGTPGREELAMGAIATGGVRVLNDDVLRYLDIPEETIDQVTRKEAKELRRREQLYRGDRPPPVLKDKKVILVDDGLATGSTMRAAFQAVQRQEPKRVVVAVPVAPPSTCEELAELVHAVVAVITPEPFQAVGMWYEDFSQTTDEEIRQLLDNSQSELSKTGRESEA